MRNWLRYFPRHTLVVLCIIALVILIIRAVMPYFVLRYVNGVLGSMPDYWGHARDVELSLWRGAYKIYDLQLEKRKGKTREPFIDAPEVDFSVEWGSLFHGAVVGEVEINRPKVNLVDAPTRAQTQLTISGEWSKKFEQLFPLKLNRVQVHKGTVNFINHNSNPPVYLQMTQLEMLGTDLSNQKGFKKEYQGKVDIRSNILKTGKLKSHLDINPIAHRPDFRITVELLNVKLPEMNDFLKAYAMIDAESGRFELFSEARAKEGRIQGYLKPIITDLSLVRLEDLVENPLKMVWEIIVSTFTFIFTNHSKDTVATRIPFEGKLEDPEPDWLALIGNLFSNAFIQHIAPELDKQGVPALKLGEKKESERAKDDDDEDDSKKKKKGPVQLNYFRHWDESPLLIAREVPDPRPGAPNVAASPGGTRP